jgi:uncharacterized membrane protein
MNQLSLPVRYGLLGLLAGLLGVWLSSALGQSPGAPWWVIMLAGGVGGLIAGFIRKGRSG